MIVSKKNKLIFIGAPKTGTHSITNYLISSGIEKSLPVRRVDYPTYHLTLSEILYVFNISETDLVNYKIIQSVRNPYDRMVSAWSHQMKILNENIGFDEFLKKVKLNKHLLPNNIDSFYNSFYGNMEHKTQSYINNNWGGLRFYYEQNWFNDININVKYFKLEDLKNSTKELSGFLNIPENKFPHINKNTNLETNTNYNTLYINGCKEIVSELYYNDIKIFDYEF